MDDLVASRPSPWIITELDRTNGCKHVQYFLIVLDLFAPGGYVEITSFNSYFLGIKKRNHSPTRIYHAERELEFNTSWKIWHKGEPLPELKRMSSLWEFYKFVGFDYKKKKYVES